MLPRKLAVVALTGLLLIPIATTNASEYEVWVSPLPMSTGDPRLTIAPTVPPPFVRITTTGTGDYQWVDLGLTLSSNLVIDSVKVCYELANSSSYISQIRLTRGTTPDVAVVMYDDPTDLTVTGPTCYTTGWAHQPVIGMVTLSLRLDFASTTDWIEIGGMSLYVSEAFVAAPQAPGETPQLSLRQNYPNPFNPSTTIQYSVDRPDVVRLQILDVSGRLVRTLVDEEKPQGRFTADWDGRDAEGRKVASGTYYYLLRVGDRAGSKGMVLIQ